MSDIKDLNNEELSAVGGGASTDNQVDSSQRACNLFSCKKCHTGLNNHHLWDTSKDPSYRSMWICRNKGLGMGIPEWPGHRITCEHCDYLDSTSGKCTREQ